MLKIYANNRKIVRLCNYLCFATSKRNYNNKNNLKCDNILMKKISINVNLRKNFCAAASDGSEQLLHEDVDVDAVTGGDPELLHKLKVIILEAEVMRQEGKNIPSAGFMKTQHWQEIIKMETRTSRKKYLDFLFRVEKKKENIALRKEQKRAQREEIKPEVINNNNDDGSMSYRLGKNNILLRVRDGTMNQMYNNRLIQAMQFGQKLVLDCGYDSDMTTRENNNCAKQLMLLFAENRDHDDPYDLHYCNTNPNSRLMQSLHRYISTMYEPWFPLNIHEQSYLDLFPKNQLVYLTPHCREELHDYDHDTIYIIGAIVDKVNQEPLSLAKAKKEGLRMAKLPLDRYLQWGAGSGKSLTLNQVTSILLDVKHTGDWKHAFRHVPKRKLYNENIGPSISKTTNHLPFDTDEYTKSARKSWRPKLVTYDSMENKEKEKRKIRNILENE